jgi:hypothetical protein
MTIGDTVRKFFCPCGSNDKAPEESLPSVVQVEPPPHETTIREYIEDFFEHVAKTKAFMHHTSTKKSFEEQETWKPMWRDILADENIRKLWSEFAAFTPNSPIFSNRQEMEVFHQKVVAGVIHYDSVCEILKLSGMTPSETVTILRQEAERVERTHSPEISTVVRYEPIYLYAILWLRPHT